MKVCYFLLIIVAAVLGLSCNNGSDSLAANVTLASPTPLPNVYLTEAGHAIKRDGWLPKELMLGKRLKSATARLTMEDGRIVSVKYTTFVLKSPLILEKPYFSDSMNANSAPAITNAVTAATVGTDKPFCYNLFLRKETPIVSNNNDWHDHTVAMRYCDSDGDGIFETNVMVDFRVPMWVK
jgi:hypothetical protein